jgi:two-component system, OmpR family, sensor kinase
VDRGPFAENAVDHTVSPGGFPAGESKSWQDLLGSMRVRILAAVVVLLAGSSAVSILVARASLIARLEEEVTVDLRQEAAEFQLLASGLDPRTGAPFGDDLEALFDLYFRREVVDEGESLLTFLGDRLYASERAAGVVEAGELDEAIAHWLSLDEREEGQLDTAVGHVRYVALPLASESQDGLFVVANFPALERAEIDDAVRTQVLTQFGAILLASLLGLVLAGRVLRPLRSLTDTAQTISETDLARRIPVRGRDEASRIAGAFNDMLGRIERAFTAQRQFLDDASHELRAPLTVIRGHVEMLEFETDPEERRATTTLITNEIERMSRIVEDLLLLAKAERPDFFTMEPVDIAELTTDVYRKAVVLCARDWQLESTANAVIRADGQRLTQALMQLAQNACEHTDDGASIRIGSRAEDGLVRLWVHDSGAGVPPDDAQRIFERFVKGSDRPAGSGLGLPIVAAIAQAHGGYARLASDTGPGARFEIVVLGQSAQQAMGGEPTSGPSG